MNNDSKISADTEGVNLPVTSENFFRKNSRNITFYFILSLLLIIIFYFPSWLCAGGDTCYELKGSPVFRVFIGIPLIVLLYALRGIKTWRVIGEFMLLFSLFGIGGALLAYQKIINVSEQNFFENWHIFSIFFITWLVVVIGFFVYQSILTTLRKRAFVYVLILICELYMGIAVGTMIDKEINTPRVTAPPVPMGFL